MGKASNELRSNSGGLRRGLMLYGSTAAMAAALMLAEGGLAPALAQEIGPRIVPTHAAQGDFIAPGPSPSPSFEFRSAELDIVNMRRDSVLNWTTYDNAPPGGAQGNSYVNFLPEGAELRFTGNGQSFTAINRVFTTPDQAGAYRGIAIQGRVTSYLFGDGPNSVGPVGGNIWFYSPGGILATGTSSFNVGSLLLSASDLDNFTEYGTARQVELTGVTNPFASVILQQGARIELTQPNSSLAIVAPTIEQGGDVIVDGSVLYMSAERGGLYFYSDGTIGSGIYQESQAGNTIRHTGSTTGPASIATDDFGVFDAQIIEFRTGADVGVLLSGTLGYAPASSAEFGPNGTIILSVGGVSTAGDLTLTSNVSIDAPEVELNFAAGDQLTMGGDANGAYSLFVDSPDVSLTAGARGRIDIAGNVLLNWDGFQPAELSVSAEAGDPNDNPGGRIDIGGSLTLNASAGRQGSTSQQAGRAEVSIGDFASIDVGGQLSLLADSYAVEDEGGITAANGGRATLTMTGEASLDVGDALTISAQAFSADRNCECSNPPGGSGTGGYAAFTASGGTVEIGGQLSVSASAEAHEGFFSYDDGVLDAVGGTALVSLGDSSASLANVFVTADATGANSEDEIPGGSATGGTASFTKGAGGSLYASQLVVTAEATGGQGVGFNGEGYSRADGGDAQGGIASIVLGQTADDLNYLELSVAARAGNGSDATEFSGESGGDGGDAIGGSATLTLSGEGNSLSGLSESRLAILARGGNGGDGETDFNQGFQAGDGGTGGSAQGGNLSVTAFDGAEFSWGGSFDADVQAGIGGSGGNQTIGEGGPSTIGLGGDGGDATGASFTFTADGGLISGDLILRADALAGGAGLDGRDFEGNFTGAGDSGMSQGGAISLIARDNGTSRFEIGDASLFASGDIAGMIGIHDLTIDPEAGMRFGSLYAQANGASISGDANFRLGAVSNPISVTGTAQVEANSIALEFTDSGRLDIGGSALLSSFGGDINISHANNGGFFSVHASGQFNAYADGNFDAGEGSIVASGGTTEIRATGSISAAETNSLSNVVMNAQGNVAVGDIIADGDIELFAGRLDYENGTFYQPGGRVTVSGDVTSGESVFVTSGGFAEFTSGSSVSADNDIWVRTGDDIIIASGASLTSDIDPDLDLSIHLLAGDINVGDSDGDLLEPIGTPIASLVLGGTLNSNGASIYLSGDAIEASGSSIFTRNLYVDVTDAPQFGPFSNDGGLLPVNCRQGSACLGTIAADGAVAIGLDSNNGLISLRAGQISFSGDTFDVVTLDRLELTGGNFASSVVAGQRISLESINDAIALSDISLEAPTLRLRAATDLDGPTANLTGLNSLEISVGNNLSANNIYAVNGLDDGSDTNTFTVPGDFTATSLTYVSGVDMRIVAGGNLSLGTADPTGADIDLLADGSLYLGSSAANSGAIRLEGQSVEFNNLRSSGLVNIIAGEGGITGVSEGGAQIDTTGAIGLESDGDVQVGELVAGADITISGTDIAAATLTAGGDLTIGAGGAAVIGTFLADGSGYFSGASLDLGSGSTGGEISASATGDIAFTDLQTGTDAYFAAVGTVLGGDVAAAGELFLLAGDIVLGEASGATGVTFITQGDATFTSLESSEGSISLDVAASMSGTLIDAADDVIITGGLVAVEEISAGGDLSIESSNIQSNILSAGGDIALSLEGGALIGEAVAGGDLSLSAGNGITAESLVAGNALTVTSDTPAAITEANAGTDLTISASILQSTSLLAGGSIVVDAGAGATIEEAVAGGSFAFTGSGLTAENIEAGANLDVAVSLLATIESFSSEGDATLSGRSLDLGMGSSGGDLSAQASEGALSFTLLAADGNSALSASGAITGGSAAAGGTLTVAGASVALTNGSGANGVTVTTPGTASFTTLASSGGSISVDAGGAVTGGGAQAAASLSIDGASVALNSASFGAGLLLTANSGNLTGSGLYQGSGSVSLIAEQGIAIGSVDALGGIMMSAGAEARFVELRSRDGSVDVTAGGAIVGSSVAATGSNAAGDNVSLTAGGAITLDGAVTTLNASSRAEDDFTAQAGGALNIVRGEAGRDVSFTAGAGMLSAADVAAGRDLSLTGPAVQLVDGEVARSLTVTATEGDITGSGSTVAGGTVQLDASGDISIGSLSANGGDLAASAGGGIGFTDLYASGAIALSAGEAIAGSDLDATNGIFATGTSMALADVSAGEGSANLQASDGSLTADSVTGAGLSAAAAGSLTVGTVDVGGFAQLSGASVAFDSVSAGGSVGVQSGGEIDGGAVSAGGFASIYAQDAITLTGLTAGDAYLESEEGAVTASGIAIDGLLVARGTSLALEATGALEVAAEAYGGAIGISSSGNLTVEAQTSGDITLASTGGSVIITNVDRGEGEGSTGDFIGEGASGGATVTVTAANGISVLEGFTTGGALTMTAGGLVSLEASVSGQTIAIQAGDLAIGGETTLGSSSTQRISLASTNAVNLGTGASGGFAVDAGEFGRIRSGGDLMITALAGEGGGSGALTVGSLTVNAGSNGQIGTSGTFGLTANRVLDVNSTLAIAGAGAGSTLMLTGDTVDLDYANAQISVLDSTNAAAGRIVANGRLITSLSASAAADIVGKTPAEVNVRLGQADTAREIALFRTANLTLEGRDAILIQNSGGADADARRGLSAGAVTIRGRQDGGTLVIVNGVIGSATGISAAQAATLSNALAAGSTFNGCALANIAACLIVPEPPPPLIVAPESILFGTGDLIRSEENEDDEIEDGVADGKNDAPPIDTTRIDDPAGLPMIDDPVTGAGNEDLWQQPDQ